MLYLINALWIISSSSIYPAWSRYTPLPLKFFNILNYAIPWHTFWYVSLPPMTPDANEIKGDDPYTCITENSLNI